MITREFFVWVEKYRPQTLGDCILPTSVRQTLNGILQQSDMPNLLLTGKAGTGKTTVARAIAADLDMDVLVINASDENGIDVLRTKLKDFASSVSFDGKRKMLILDEADYLNPQSTQPALRAFMEEFAGSCVFVLTCNHSNRIIAPLHSRCSVVNFSVPKTERADIMSQFAKRVFEILDTESITYDKRLVLEVVQQHFPDFRRTLNELQRFSSTGTLQTDILSQVSDKDVAALMKALSTADFNATRKWMAEHEDIDEATFYRMLSDQLPKHIKNSDLPQAILTLADYSYRSAFAADKSLNMLACLTEIMGGLQVEA
jgi:DNA polymerase III delta prime subunit